MCHQQKSCSAIKLMEEQKPNIGSNNTWQEASEQMTSNKFNQVVVEEKNPFYSKQREF